MKKRLKNSDLGHYVKPGPSPIHGTGLFARRGFGKGHYIGTYHGVKAHRNGKYVLWIFDSDDENDITGISGKNLLRYLNHARPGNAEFKSADLYARITIKPGDEITFDYGEEW